MCLSSVQHPKEPMYNGWQLSCHHACQLTSFMRNICWLNNGNTRPPALCAEEAPDENYEKSTNWSLIIIGSICYGDRARLVDGSVSQFCSDHPLPELFRVLQCRWYGLVKACQQLSQLRGYLTLECQEGGCFAFLLQSSCATWIWERWVWKLLSTWVQCIQLKRKVICYQLELGK